MEIFNVFLVILLFCDFLKTTGSNLSLLCFAGVVIWGVYFQYWDFFFFPTLFSSNTSIFIFFSFSFDIDFKIKDRFIS